MDKTQSRLFRLSLIPVSILLLALPALADSNALEVKCLDPAGNPVKDVGVIISLVTSGKSKDKKTDAKGVAQFTKLDDGVYRVLGRKDGFAPAFYEFAALKGGSQASVALKLEQGNAQQKLYFEDPALARKAMELLSQGTELLRTNKFADAEKQIKEAVDINPSDPNGLFNLAIAYLQQRKWDQADQTLKTMTKVLTAMKELPPPKEGNPPPYDQLLQKAQAIIAQVPAFRLRSEGDQLLAEKKFDEAAAKYLEALKSQGNDADLYYNLALAQANGKQFDAGLQSIDKAITLRPNETAFTELKKRIADFKDNETLGNAQSVLNDGDKLFKAADYPNALAKYQEALKMIPDEKKSQQAVVLDQIAKTEAELKQGDSAIATWQKAIDAVEADSAYKDALGKLAECRKANQGSASDKCAAPQQEVTKYATRADMYRNDQAQFFIKEKKYDQAIDLYEKTFSDPNAAGNQPMDQSLFNLGQKLSNQDASEVAQLAFERAIKVNPQNAEAYYELGMLLYQGKKADKQAVDMLSKYLELGKDTAHKENAQNVLVVLKRRMK